MIGPMKIVKISLNLELQSRHVIEIKDAVKIKIIKLLFCGVSGLPSDLESLRLVIVKSVVIHYQTLRCASRKMY